MAHAIKILPAISAAFAEGELSYTKVRELTRVANQGNEQNLVDFALRTTASNVAQRCRELRMGDEVSIDAAARAFANRSLRIRRDHHRGTMMVSVELPIESVKRICCDSHAVVLTENKKGEPLSNWSQVPHRSPGDRTCGTCTR